MLRIGRAAMLAAGLCLVAGMADTARAGIITSATVVTNGNGTAKETIKNTANAHAIAANKMFTAVGPIDLVQHVGGANTGTTTYTVSESIQNNTGSAMKTFTVELGSGSGGSFSQPPPNGVMFTAANFPPLSADYSNGVISNSGTTLTFSGGSIPNGTSDSLLFQITVPSAPGGVPYDFTIRNLPGVAAVPEPSTLALAGIGGLGLLLSAIRRRKTNAV